MYAYDKEARLQRIRAYIDLINRAKPEDLLHIFSAEPALELEDPLPINYNNMAERTLKELGAPKTGEDPLCIVFSELENPLKLNSARKLISNMAQNTQQFSTRNDVKRVNEIDISGIHNQLQENSQQIATLTTLVSKIASTESKSRVCGVCSDFSHATGECPTLQSEDVNALGGFFWSTK
uniref:Uncharacterized protein n=1 Tax=Chenopodium quinoa TaxID=63459 RepID=A0A803N5U1_CHEQI